MSRSLAAAFLLLALVPRGAAEEIASYPMRGVLRSVDPKTGQATVSHEAVPGYMPAMTMDFALADPGALDAVHPGDTFTCRLRVAPDRAWIEAIHREDAPAAATVPVPGARRSAELNPGDPLPDIALLDERGRTVRLRDFRGKALAVSFVYLRCPLPTYCPLTNHNFQSAQTLLERLGLKDHAHFLSVSMDAAHDTPARLAEFAEALEADEAFWTFASAGDADLHALGDAVGLEFRRQADAISHNLRTVVIDPRGKLRRVFRGNAWTPQELAAELRAAAATP